MRRREFVTLARGGNLADGGTRTKRTLHDSASIANLPGVTMRTVRYSNIKERWFAVVTVMVAIVTSLAAFEMGLRLFPPTWLRSRMEFLTLDQGEATFGSDASFPRRMQNGGFWGLEPNSEVLVASDEYVNTAHVDELGGRKVNHEAADASLSVLPFLGDSFTFGAGVSDEETFASVLSGEFKELRILNLGNPGTALDQQRKTVAVRHAELGSPKKYVFFFFIGNDFFDLMNSTLHAVSPEAGGGPMNMPQHLNRLVLHNGILRQSYLIQFARAPLLRFVGPRQKSIALSPVDAIFPIAIFHIMNVLDEAYLNRARAALVSELNGLAHMQREYGFSSLIVAIPDRHQINEKLRRMNAIKYNLDYTALDPDRPNLLLKNSVAAAGISFFDATSCLRAAADPSTLYYTMDDHFTAVGHRTFARCLAPELKRFLSE